MECRETLNFKHLTLRITNTQESTRVIDLLVEFTELLVDNNIIVYPESIGGMDRPELHTMDGCQLRRGFNEIKSWLTELKKGEGVMNERKSAEGCNH